MTKQGLHKIVGKMFRGPLTLSELADLSNLSKPTVHHHMKKLLREKIVQYNKKTGKYTVKIESEIKTPILESLTSPKTLDQLGSYLKKLAEKESSEKSPLKILVKDKDFRIKLNDLVEFLFDEELVTETKEHVLSDSKFTTIELITLTWVGCVVLNICHVCKQPLNDDVAVAHIIQTDYPTDFTAVQAPLIHPKCVSTLADIYSSYWINGSHSDDYCHYCGLSLSEKSLANNLKYNGKCGKTGFNLIYDLLTLSEIEKLNNWKRKKLEKQFMKQYDIPN